MPISASPPQPRPLARLLAPLVGVGMLFAVTLGVVGFPDTAVRDPAAAGHVAVAMRDLRFQDRADGGVVVLDAQRAEAVATLEPASDHFIRASLRGLVRERRAGALGDQAPFRLALWADGSLTLQDTATGRIVALNAFGQTNAAAFARLLGTDLANRAP